MRFSSQATIGNRSDGYVGGVGVDSLYALAGNMAYQHVHSPANCYPDLADPVVITASANAWTDYGAWTEIIPASTITNAFDIHWIFLSMVSASGNYQLQLGYGGAGSEITLGTVAFSRGASALNSTVNVPTQAKPVPPNSRIAARLSSSNAVADTCGIKIYYHEYL